MRIIVVEILDNRLYGHYLITEKLSVTWSTLVIRRELVHIQLATLAILISRCGYEGSSFLIISLVLLNGSVIMCMHNMMIRWIVARRVLLVQVYRMWSQQRTRDNRLTLEKVKHHVPLSDAHNNCGDAGEMEPQGQVIFGVFEEVHMVHTRIDMWWFSNPLQPSSSRESNKFSDNVAAKQDALLKLYIHRVA
ncbi:hypothetical protein ACJX0J_030098 [Zea mays]